MEPSLAADPYDANHLVAAWQQGRVAAGAALANVAALTRDGGDHWSRQLLPKLTRCSGSDIQLATDPAVSIGADHTAYVISLRLQPGRGSGHTEVVVSASRDGGSRWSAPSVVATTNDPPALLDKPNVLADPQTRGRVYAVWVRYDDAHADAFRPDAPSPARDHVFVSRSDDWAKTWSAPSDIYFSPSEVQFSQLLWLGKDRIADVFIEGKPALGAELRQSPTATIRSLLSTDGGESWQEPTTGATFPQLGVTYPHSQLPIRAAGWEISAASADGKMYVAWCVPRASGSSQVLLAISDGTSWSSPTVVATHPGPVFLPIVAAGRSGVGVLWYGSADTVPGATLPTSVWFSTAKSASSTWRTNELSAGFDLRTAPRSGGLFVGDYEGLVAIPAGFAAVFVQSRPASRSGPTDVFFWSDQAAGS